MIKKIAWNTFKNTGDVNTFLELKQIQNIVEQDKEGKWIVEELGYPYINIPIMVGAPTINCTNVYPRPICVYCKTYKGAEGIYKNRAFAE